MMSNRNYSASKTRISIANGWRPSLVGVNVYNDANEKIGDINEVILDKSGKASNVILGVGGFLGMGEHYVAVAYDKLKWVNEPARTSTTTPTADKPPVGVNNAGAATGEVNRSNSPMRAANENWYSDQVIYNATKYQLRAMPQFILKPNFAASQKFRGGGRFISFLKEEPAFCRVSSPNCAGRCT